MRKLRFLLLFLALGLTGCGKDSEMSADSRASGDPRRGRGIYAAYCIACHNSDPARDGPIGPAIAGSPRPLIEARILGAAYPPGYAPKRDTRIMPAMPHLKRAIPDLAAYLNEGDKKGAT
jgi:mono/diheme cytochrome c family protein